MIFSLITWAGFWLAQTPQTGGGSGVPTSIIVAFITALATFGGAYLMFRGKTQDTANWLIIELRNEAKSARESAADCDEARQEQTEKIEILEAQVRSLTRRVTDLNEKVSKYQDCDKLDE